MKNAVTLNSFAELTFSPHYYERSLERLKVEREKAENLAYRAVRNGKTIYEYSGNTRKKLEEKFAGIRELGRTVYIHGCNGYIFSDTGVVITVYPLDKTFFEPKRKKMSFSDDDDSIVVGDHLDSKGFVHIIISFLLNFISLQRTVLGKGSGADFSVSRD